MKIKIPVKRTKSRLTRNRSKFNSYVFPVSNEEEASKIIKEVRKRNNKAAHIPYAYYITKFQGNIKRIYRKYSDDGEPHKTAGYTLLRLIQNSKITNTLIITARIFGGVKLGMSNLRNAFKDSAEKALEVNTIVNKELCEEFVIKTNLQEYSQIESILKQHRVKFNHSFDDNSVEITAFIPIDKKDLKQKIRRIVNS